MTHAEVTNEFVRWFAAEHQPDWLLFPNRSGVADFNGRTVPYGVPPTGGGPDFIAFGPGGRVRFYEVKTVSAPRLRANQVKVARELVARGHEVYKVMETESAPWFKIERLRDI